MMFTSSRMLNFYPRPPRGGRPTVLSVLRCAWSISIHALREEGDPCLPVVVDVVDVFLSTPSARRATLPRNPARWSAGHFYPRPPRGGRLAAPSAPVSAMAFLSTPSARRATLRGDFCRPRLAFLSTPSARRATGAFALCQHFLPNFYPRPPRGGRPPPHPAGRVERYHFYPRPPRGGRPAHWAGGLLLYISIHALREEGDGKNGEKHLRFCFIIKRSAQIWKSFSKNIRKKSCDLHRMP